MSVALELKKNFSYYYPKADWEEEMDFDIDDSFAQSEFDEGDIEDEAEEQELDDDSVHEDDELEYAYSLSSCLSSCRCGNCMDCLGMSMRDFI